MAKGLVLGTAVGVLLALAVPLSGPAAADAGCLTEVRPTPTLADPFPASCDDTTPPGTRITDASPRPNVAGWAPQGRMTVRFTAEADDGDAGPFGFECRLSGPASVAHGWRACTSPVTYDDLPDTGLGELTLEVRAIDTADAALVPRNGLGLPVPEVPDHDPSPAVLTWGIDTEAPRGYLTVDAWDELTPEHPVVLARGVVVRVNASEPGARLECRDRGRALPCTVGSQRLTGLASGPHAIRARAVDAAGNASAWTGPERFTVPVDLRRPRGTGRRDWHIRSARGHLDRTVLVARRRGARLTLTAGPRRVRELRVYADRAPRAGRIRVRVGRGAWRTVDLRGPRARSREYVVLAPWHGARRGRVQLEVVSRGRPVRLDALLVR